MSMEDSAYEFAAAWHGVKVKGRTPTVRYVTKLSFAGKPIVGKYRSYRIPIVRWVIWDRIWVVKGLTPVQDWSNVCHEMSHCLDARRGKDKNESKATAVEASAYNAGVGGIIA